MKHPSIYDVVITPPNMSTILLTNAGSDGSRAPMTKNAIAWSHVGFQPGQQLIAIAHRMRIESHGTEAIDDILRGNILLGGAPGIIDRQEIERVVRPEDGPKGCDVFILQESRRTEPVRLVYGDYARRNAPRCAYGSRYLCRIMRKIVDHMHVLLCLGHGKTPGHAFEISYRFGKSLPVAAEMLADAKRRAQVFKVVVARKRQMIFDAACEKA